MLKLTIAAALVALSTAECPNACSGHGLCREHDACKCDPNYMGADCSLRVCPFDLAFVDTPRGDLNHDGSITNDASVKVQWSNVQEYETFPNNAAVYQAGDNEAHFYAECSGKGECDRSSGECKCFAGFTGSGCQRATCPKDCSGHGVCRTLREIAGGALNKRETQSIAGNDYFSGVRSAFDYNLWDADKNQACVCDAGYSGIDCSLRQCPRGDDPLTIGDRWCGGATCTWEVQKFTISSSDSTTYKLGFTDSLHNTLYTFVTVDGSADAKGFVADAEKNTKLPGPTTLAGQFMSSLRNIPGGLLQRVEVYPTNNLANTDVALDALEFRVTFVGVSGDQNSLTVEQLNSGTGVYTAKTVTEVANGNYEDIECSSRGLCDYSAGLCKCFNGYFGASCEFQSALAM